MNLHPKVSASLLSGLLTALVVFAFGVFGATVPPEAASLITVAASLIAGYFKAA